MSLDTPREADLGLRRIENVSGLSISVLPNGCLFAFEHRHQRGQTLINQIQGSPLDGGIARLLLRAGAPEPRSGSPEISAALAWPSTGAATAT